MSSIPAEIPYPQEPKQPLLLLVDVSGSMTPRITRLASGLRILKEEILKDDVARRRVEVAIMAFGGSNDESGVKLVQDFVPVEKLDVDYVSGLLIPGGLTPMGHALLKAIETVERRKQQYKEQGINYYRPWIWLITDGYPTDIFIPTDELLILSVDHIIVVDDEVRKMIQEQSLYQNVSNPTAYTYKDTGTEPVYLSDNIINMLRQRPRADITKYCSNDLYNTVVSRLKTGIDNKKFILWPVVVGKPGELDLVLGFMVLRDCIMSRVDPTRPPVWLEDTEQKWSAMFQWLSTSIKLTSTSRPGETQKLPDISGWAQIKVV